MRFYIARSEATKLEHHGILGMHWGIRRYQNKDGTLTPAGKKRYDEDFTTREEGNTLKKKPSIAKKALISVASLAIGIGAAYVASRSTDKVYRIMTKASKDDVDALIDDMGPVIINRRTGEIVT